jgi:gas vesicle protein
MNRDMCGFLIGVGAGVGLGVLLAPRSGEKTRSLIRERATDGAEYLRQRGTDVHDAANDVIRESSRKITKGTEAVKAAVDAGKQAYTEAMQS